MTIQVIMTALTIAYETAFAKTWTIFKKVPVKEGDTPTYEPYEIPENSFYCKKATPELNIFGTDKWGIFGFLFTGGVLSNWYPCVIHFNGLFFHSLEQLFMYIKATMFHASSEVVDMNLEIAKQILACTCPRKMQGLGRQLSISSKWEEYRLRVIMLCIILKFTQVQNAYLKTILEIIFKSTGKIYEANDDKNYAIGFKKLDNKGKEEKFDPQDEDHYNPVYWTGSMFLTDVYDKAMNAIFNDGMTPEAAEHAINTIFG
jgi:ribA/ribD-fused uncharacterized protein